MLTTPDGGLRRRSNVAMTSSAVKGVPSWNLTPWRRWKVYVRPSGDTSHFWARSGMIDWPPSSGLNLIRLSYIGDCGHRLTRLGDWSRSKCAGSPGPAMVKTPPFLAFGSGAAIRSADVPLAGAVALAGAAAAGAD